MFATGIILALFLGFFIGVVTAVTAALYWDAIEQRKTDKKKAKRLDEAKKLMDDLDHIHAN